jgi:phospholipid-binding lipoprotein MlaA
MYSLNDALDSALIKPAAKGYEAIVPGLFRDMAGNFFGNLRDVWTAANQLLQGKPREGFSDISRVVINSTFGFFGIADVASEMGLEKHEEDFGQTLGVWGVPSGPYLVLPFFGPSSVRDGIARVPDFFADPLLEIDSHGLRNNLWLTRVLDTRVRLFPAERLLQGAALDKYSFTRDAWLQRRRNQIHDGNPPPSDDDYDSNPPPTYDEEGIDDPSFSSQK